MNDIESYGIQEGTEVVKGFLNKIVSPVFEELGLMMADKVRTYRWKNQIKILKSAQKYIDEQKIPLKTIPVKLLVPLLENASLEEDESLQEKWRNLLVNYVDSSKNFSSSVYPYLLSQLSSNEALFLWELFSNIVNLNYTKVIVPDGKDFSFKEYHISDALIITSEEIFNLKRLGVIFEEEKIVSDKKYMVGGFVNSRLLPDKDTYELKETGIIRLTDLGEHFIGACSL